MSQVATSVVSVGVIHTAPQSHHSSIGEAELGQRKITYQAYQMQENSVDAGFTYIPQYIVELICLGIQDTQENS